MAQIMWWGYLHANNTIQVKRWLGDRREYTEECDGNYCTLAVVPPFAANSRAEAEAEIMKRLS